MILLKIVNRVTIASLPKYQSLARCEKDGNGALLPKGGKREWTA